MKRCSKCHALKDDSSFYARGLVCKSCKREYNLSRYSGMTSEQRADYNASKREYYQGEGRAEIKRRAKEQYGDKKEVVRRIKSEHGCLRCGESDSSSLDFHHIAEKSNNIGQGRTFKLSTIMSEISKCIVLCANCHRKLHSGSWQLSDLYAKMESEYPEAYELLNQS